MKLTGLLNIEDIIPLAEAKSDASYARVVASKPLSFYRERIIKIGFVGQGTVIDLGCGYGQWSVALSEFNQRVIGIDRHAGRVEIAKTFAARAGAENVEFACSDAEKLPFADESADAIFCYGVFMFLRREQAISEWLRVLRPGGQAYVCTNDRGWWLNLAVSSLLNGDRNNLRSASRAFVGLSKDTIPNSTSPRSARNLFARPYWESVESASEGCLVRSVGFERPMKAYASRYLGLRSVIEFVARKAQVLSSETPEARILNAVRTTATKEDYGYSRFGEFKISSIHDGTVEGRHVEFETVYAAIRDSLRVDRAAQLRRVFGLISEGARNEEDVLLRCLTFSQRHFFHHFAGQPLQRNGVSVLDPIASLMIGTARCGSSARFLVDLFECQGISARLITGACHTSAEVRIGDRWLLADASLYPPGVHPISSDGRWLTLDEAAEDPGLLDRVPNYINYHHEYIDRFVASYPEYSDGEDIRLLRTPILPSSGYFSSDILRAGNRGVERLKKVGAVADWVGDLDFGWSQGFEKQTLEVRGVETVFRPGQARGIVRAGAKLVWRAADRYAAQQPVRYRVVGRDAPRGWEYDRLSSGCRFDVSGNSTVVDTNEMPEGSARSLGRFITIFSEIAKADEGRFYLPSTEFDLDRIP